MQRLKKGDTCVSALTRIHLFIHCRSFGKRELWLVLREGQVRLLHQQNELNETLSLIFKFAINNNRICSIFAATILGWKKLLKPGKYEDIIISSLQFLVENKRVMTGRL
jgi:hypothetical protein